MRIAKTPPLSEKTPRKNTERFFTFLITYFFSKKYGGQPTDACSYNKKQCIYFQNP